MSIKQVIRGSIAYRIKGDNMCFDHITHFEVRSFGILWIFDKNGDVFGMIKGNFTASRSKE